MQVLTRKPFHPVVSPSASVIAGWMSTNPSLPHKCQQPMALYNLLMQDGDELDKSIGVAARYPSWYYIDEVELENRRRWASTARNQAEHDPDSQVVLEIAGDGMDVEAIDWEIKMCESLPGGDFASKELAHSSTKGYDI